MLFQWKRKNEKPKTKGQNERERERANTPTTRILDHFLLLPFAMQIYVRIYIYGVDSAHLHTQALWVMKLASHFNLKWTLERRRGEKPVCWACNALFHFKTMIPCSLHAKPRLPRDVVLPFFICLFCFLYKMFSVKSMGLVCPKTTNKFNIKKMLFANYYFFLFLSR